MSLPRSTAKLRMKRSPIRLFTSSPAKSMEISTCTNIKYVKKSNTKTKDFLGRWSKNNSFSQPSGRVRFTSLRNVQQDKIDYASLSNNANIWMKSTPKRSVNSLEDHLQPKTILTNSSYSFSILNGKLSKPVKNKYLHYLQKERKLLNIKKHTNIDLKPYHEENSVNVEDKNSSEVEEKVAGPIESQVIKESEEKDEEQFDERIDRINSLMCKLREIVSKFKTKKDASDNFSPGFKHKKNHKRINNITNLSESLEDIVNDLEEVNNNSYRVTKPLKESYQKPERMEYAEEEHDLEEEIKPSSWSVMEPQRENIIQKSIRNVYQIRKQPTETIDTDTIEENVIYQRPPAPYPCFSEALSAWIGKKSESKIHYDVVYPEEKVNSVSNNNQKLSVNLSQPKKYFSTKPYTSGILQLVCYCTSKFYSTRKCAPPSTIDCKIKKKKKKEVKEQCFFCFQPTNPECPPVVPEKPKYAPPLKRLNLNVPEPPRICPVETCEDMIRADDNLQIKPKKLPCLPLSTCPCVEPFVPSIDVPLKRLKPKPIPKKSPRICIEDTCPPRADDNLKICPKKLPYIGPSDCPCVEPEIPKKAPPLKRLNLKVKEPPRVCPPCEEFCCPPRMDEGLKIVPKKLPRLKISDCPCVEPFVPNKNPCLKRLGPINIKEPPKVCPVDECPPERKIVKVERKKLQTLILNESYNTMSTKEYNARKLECPCIPKRKFGTCSQLIKSKQNRCDSIDYICHRDDDEDDWYIDDKMDPKLLKKRYPRSYIRDLSNYYKNSDLISKKFEELAKNDIQTFEDDSYFTNQIHLPSSSLHKKKPSSAKGASFKCGIKRKLKHKSRRKRIKNQKRRREMNLQNHEKSNQSYLIRSFPLNKSNLISPPRIKAKLYVNCKRYSTFLANFKFKNFSNNRRIDKKDIFLNLLTMVQHISRCPLYDPTSKYNIFLKAYFLLIITKMIRKFEELY